jgi:tetratricopeptide (TPR) repeat protein
MVYLFMVETRGPVDRAEPRRGPVRLALFSGALIAAFGVVSRPARAQPASAGATPVTTTATVAPPAAPGLASPDKCASQAHVVFAGELESPGLIGDGIACLPPSSHPDARAVFDQARGAKPGKGRDDLWRHAAETYESELRRAPESDGAAEAALAGAAAYRQVGEFGRAIEMYSLLIDAYGRDVAPDKQPKADAHGPANTDTQRARLAYLEQAYDGLSTAYYGSFDYLRAAETFDRVAATTRFDAAHRRRASRDALVLYASLRQRDRAQHAYRTLASLHPSADEKLSADFALANYDYLLWSSANPDGPAMPAVRHSAETALEAFYRTNRGNPSAAMYSLLAAYRSFKVKRTAGDAGWSAAANTTLAAWAFLRAHPPPTTTDNATSPPLADLGAEAEFTLFDDQVSRDYDYETGHQRYAGAVEDVIGRYDKNGELIAGGDYQRNEKAAQTYDQAFEHILATYRSGDWSAAAVARQGTLYDSLRTGLWNAVPPAVHLFNQRQLQLLLLLAQSPRPNVVGGAQDLRDVVKEHWPEERGGAPSRRRANGPALRRRGRPRARVRRAGPLRDPRAKTTRLLCGSPRRRAHA